MLSQCLRRFSVCIALLPTMAYGAMVYEQLPDGPNNTQNGFFSDGNQGVQFYDNRIADDFQLAAAASVNQVAWWGGSENFNSPDILLNTSAFVIKFYSSAIPTEPPIASFTIPIGSITAVATGNLNVAGGTEYLFTANLPTPVPVPGGTSYSIHIGAILIGGFGDAFAWHTANANNAFSADGITGANDGIWEPQAGDDLAFRLFGDPIDTGRCCQSNGICSNVTASVCQSLGGTFGGLGTGCSPSGNDCRGRCCNQDNECLVTDPDDCAGQGGVFGGLGSNCVVPCVGRCCLPSGTCQLLNGSQCQAASGTYGGDGSICSANGDECKGRCCNPDGTCSLTGPATCVAPNRFGGVGSNCLSLRTYTSTNPTSIPDSGASAPNIINVPDSYSIQDANVRVKIQHTFRGDINICLQSPGGGPNIQLTAGTSCTSGGDCNGEDNYNAIFDDEGAVIVCASVNLADITATPDSVIPSQALNALDGLTANGSWTLNVFDDAGGDSGTLLEWALILDPGASPCAGACCRNGLCSLLSSAACASSGGTYTGDATTCSPSPCAPNGACCQAAGCSLQAQVDCTTLGGVYGGDNSTCASPAPCQAPCCLPSGACVLQTVASCNAISGAVPGSLGTACPAAPCSPLGACCIEDGSCSQITQAGCTALGGVRWSAGVACAPNLCQGRCCGVDGTCTIKFPPGTPGGNACNAPSIYGGDGTNCNDPSVCLGRCCLPNGTCSVTAPNACAGTFSIGLNCSATTVVTFDNAGLAIADLVTNSQVRNVSGLQTPITDLDVDLNFAHTWPGDVTITLEHLGTIVTIYDRPGVPASTFGCATDDANIILDDEGTGGSIETVCNATPPSALSPPNYTPSNPLSAFDGLDPNGDWTISVSDAFSGDTGTLNQWSLHVSAAGAVCPVVSCNCRGDVNGDSAVNGKDIQQFAACVISGGGAGCSCADVNNSGGVTAADIPAMVTALLSGACAP